MNSENATQYIEFQAGQILPYLDNKPYPKTAPHYIVAAMPKSGSTLLTKLLASLPDINEVNVCEGYDRNEQELSAMRLMLFHPSGYVSHQHLRYSAVTDTLMSQFHLIPVVLVRDLCDVVISFTDHLAHTSIVFPMGYAPQDINEWSYERKCHYMIDMVVPWYFNFYLSWHDCKRKILLTYDELVANQAVVLHHIASVGGIYLDFDEINALVTQVNGGYTRKNIGVSGRGSQLSEEMVDKIYKYAGYYTSGHPDIDFSKIGLDPQRLQTA